jgi:type IX secretion system PorP/SprF family membrane protein
MKLTKALLLFLILQNLASVGFGQNLVYNHYFINPYLYNPSYLGSSGYTELFLNYRKAWSGFSGAPSTATLNLQVPLNYKLGVGVNLYNEQAGVLKTNTGMLSIAYQVYLGQSLSDVHKLGFGVSIGATNTGIDIEKINNPDIPASTKSNTTSIDGQFGLNYQYNNFKLGFALPRLLRTKVISEEDFNSPGLEPLQNTITTVSYNFKISPRIAFEPFLLYRTERNAPSQFEGLGVVKIDNFAWIGGAYRQEYGASAFLGFSIKEKIKVGYAYEFAPNQVSGFGGGSHEIQLIVRLGKNKKERPQPKEKEEETETVAETEKVDSAAQEEVSKIEEKAEEPVVITPEKEPVTEEPVTPTPEPITQPSNESKQHQTLDGDNLVPGHYVVVGAFQSVVNAKKYTTTLKKAGYPAHVAFDPVKKYFIVHMGVTSSVEEAKTLRDMYRVKSRYSFRDTWILTIE